MFVTKSLSRSQLIDLIAASNPDPYETGPIVVRTELLWDNRIIEAHYYKGPKYNHPDAETRSDVFINAKPLIPLIDRLLKTGESFVTVTGSHDMVCCLEWTIRPLIKQAAKTESN